MSVQLKEEKLVKNKDFLDTSKFSYTDTKSTKVNLNDLLERLKVERKKDKKNNIIMSAAAVAAVTAFGIILTL
jgi:hypothetical protein|tara:strand:+ start:56 stop:274 length:219 start_codon:yes stop_codon:yes gene_type:complete